VSQQHNTTFKETAVLLNDIGEPATATLLLALINKHNVHIQLPGILHDASAHTSTQSIDL
jgi:hypothetical protein